MLSSINTIADIETLYARLGERDYEAVMSYLADDIVWSVADNSPLADGSPYHVTGIIFVRFSRPVARIAFSKSMVIGPLNGQPTLMVRVGNQHQHSIVDTEFRIMFMRDEPLVEGGDFRYFYTLKLHFDKLILFPAALTLRHVIDKSSPLYGATLESLEASRSLFAVSVSGIDPIIAAPVQAQHDYSWRDVRFGERFVEIYTQSGRGQLTVDYGRLHETEPAE